MASFALPIISGLGSLFGGWLGSNAAQQAASDQVKATEQAQGIAQQGQRSALAAENGIWSGTQNNLTPFLTGGQQGLGTLETLLGLGGNPTAPGYGTLSQGFQAPTAAQAESMPGYQFQQQQMQEALQNSAAAKGNLISGNTAEAEANYANQLAGTNYQQAYGNAFNTFETNQNNQFNRLMALSGMGQQAGTALGTLGQAAGSTLSGIDMSAAAQQAQLAQNIGTEQASGLVGGANAWQGALGGMTNDLSTLSMLRQMGGMGGNTNISPSFGSSLDSTWLDTPNLPMSNPGYYGVMS